MQYLEQIGQKQMVVAPQKFRQLLWQIVSLIQQYDLVLSSCSLNKDHSHSVDVHSCWRKQSKDLSQHNPSQSSRRCMRSHCPRIKLFACMGFPNSSAKKGQACPYQVHAGEPGVDGCDGPNGNPDGLL